MIDCCASFHDLVCIGVLLLLGLTSAQAQLSVTLDAEDPVCAGFPTGEITADVSGGQMPYTYQWSTGATSPSITFLSAGTYSVTVTDNAGDTATASATLTAPTPVLVELTSSSECSTPVTIDAAPSGGTPPYGYKWDTGENTQSIQVNEAGKYCVTITDDNLCGRVACIEISTDVPEVEVVTTDVSCPGDADGTATAVIISGTAPFSYLWSNGDTSKAINNLQAGNFTVTVTDASGCSATASGTVGSPEALSLDLDERDPSCASDSDGRIIAKPGGGTPPYSYLWSTGDTTQAISSLAPGTYSVTVTDENGCVIDGSQEIAPLSNLTIEVGAIDETCPGDNDGSASVIATGGVPPYDYSWNNGGTTAEISDLQPGTYIVSVIDDEGCFATDTVSVRAADPLEIEVTSADVTDCAAMDGTARVEVMEGTAPLTFFWNTGDTTRELSNLGGGTYSVTVTDANGCSAEANTEVDAPPLLDVFIGGQAALCEGATDAIIEAIPSGGTEPFAFQWNTGDTTDRLDNIGPGTYIVTVTDPNGCEAIDSTTIDAIPAPIVTIEASELVCGGVDTASAVTTVSGGTAPYSYLWNTGDTTSNLSGLGTGMYIVTVTDINGCTAMDTVSIEVMDPLQIDLQVLDVRCADERNGAITASVEGGMPPYSYAWSTGADSASINNLLAGTYTLTVTDAMGCTAVDTATIEQPEPLTLNLLQEDLDCSQPGTGSAEAIGIGGNGMYRYLWNTDDTTASINQLDTGTYTVTVTDQLGCMAMDSIRIQDLGAPTCEIIVVNRVSAPGGSDGAAAATVTGGSKPYSFAWSDGQTDSLATDLGEGVFTATVTDAAGCTTVCEVELIAEPATEVVDSCACLDNSTGMDDGQFLERVQVNSGQTGQTWQVVVAEGVFDTESPAPPEAPLPIPTGRTLLEVDTGVYQLDFVHVEGVGYDLSVSNGIDTVRFTNTCTYPEVSITSFPEGDIEVCTTEDLLDLGIVTDRPGVVQILLDGQPVEEINPQTLEPGAYSVQVNFMPATSEDCMEILIRNLLVIEVGCPAKLGDFVWEDLDEDGQQDANEPSIPGVEVVLQQVTDGQVRNIDTTVTDATGMYMFQVDSGDYKLTFMPQDDFEATGDNQGGDDTIDSDVDPITLVTPVYSIEQGEINLTIDAGFKRPCINVTDPGEIGFDQMLCGPGNDPAPIVSLEDASGGEGEIEYLWMKATERAPFESGYFEPIPNSNSPEFDPGPIQQTTYYARCARRASCIKFLETSIIEVQVKDDARAEIIGETVVCANETATFRAGTKTEGAKISWSFSGAISPTTATGREVEVSFSSFGRFEITLTVEENGCTARSSEIIIASNNPTNCPDNSFLVHGAVMDQVQQRDAIRLDWELINDGLAYTFKVEHANDGQHFAQIAEVSTPYQVSEQHLHYEYIDPQPKPGRNYYRVQVLNARGEKQYSEVIELMLRRSDKAFMVYPNPVREELNVEFLRDGDAEVELELMNANGMRIRQQVYQLQDDRAVLDMQQLPAGLYFVRIRIGGGVSEVVKVLRSE